MNVEEVYVDGYCYVNYPQFYRGKDFNKYLSF